MFLFDFIFPKKCLTCGRRGRYLCGSCLKKLAAVRQVCPVCIKPSVDGQTHFSCKKAFSLDGLTFVWPYAGVVRKAIVALKYKYAYGISQEISLQAGRFLEKSLPISLFKKALVVPVPLTRSRENWRGFNQSVLLAKELARKRGWRLIPDLVVRKKFISPQTGLKGRERFKNVRGCFSFNPKYLWLPRNCQILIVDDVFTTGATMKEVCKVVKRQGFEKVWGLTVAR